MIDASVFVADARPSEPSHAESTALLSRAVELDAELLLPAIVLPEIASAIARGTGRSDLARRSIALYQQLPGVRLVPIDPTLAEVRQRKNSSPSPSGWRQPLCETKALQP